MYLVLKQKTIFFFKSNTNSVWFSLNELLKHHIFVKEHPDVKDLQKRDRNLLGFLNSKIVLQRHEGE